MSLSALTDCIRPIDARLTDAAFAVFLTAMSLLAVWLTPETSGARANDPVRNVAAPLIRRPRVPGAPTAVAA